MAGQKSERAVPTNSQQAVPRSRGGKGERRSKTSDLSEHVMETGELWGCQDVQGFLALEAVALSGLFS